MEETQRREVLILDNSLRTQSVTVEKSWQQALEATGCIETDTRMQRTMNPAAQLIFSLLIPGAKPAEWCSPQWMSSFLAQLTSSSYSTPECPGTCSGNSRADQSGYQNWPSDLPTRLHKRELSFFWILLGVFGEGGSALKNCSEIASETTCVPSFQCGSWGGRQSNYKSLTERSASCYRIGTRKRLILAER